MRRVTTPASVILMTTGATLLVRAKSTYWSMLAWIFVGSALTALGSGLLLLPRTYANLRVLFAHWNSDVQAQRGK